MTTSQVIEAVAFVTGVALLTWQFRWLLRAYRTERDRQARAARSPRLLVLALALTVFLLLLIIAGLNTTRRIAIAGILAVGIVEDLRRRYRR